VLLTLSRHSRDRGGDGLLKHVPLVSIPGARRRIRTHSERSPLHPRLSDGGKCAAATCRVCRRLIVEARWTPEFLFFVCAVLLHTRTVAKGRRRVFALTLMNQFWGEAFS